LILVEERTRLASSFEYGKELCQLRAYFLKRELFSGAFLRFGDDRCAQIGVFQQIERHRTDFRNSPAFARRLWKRNSLNGAVAPDA